MLFDAIMDLIWGIGVFFASILPETTGMSVTDYLSLVMESLGALNYYLPIAETFALVLGILVVFPALMGVTLTVWVWSQIRGSSARG